MPRVSDERILAAMEYLNSAGDIAMETGAPMHRVVHLMGLYGPYKAQRDRAERDRRQVEEMLERMAREYDGTGPHRTEEKLNSLQGRYWFEFEGLPQPAPKPKRGARMVPDDREDENYDFDRYFGAVVAGVETEARKDGRGAA